jgi:hypothetical protein
VNETSAVHRLDRSADWLRPEALAHVFDQLRQPAGVGQCNTYLETLTVLVENAHVQAFTAEIQTGMQHTNRAS